MSSEHPAAAPDPAAQAAAGTPGVPAAQPWSAQPQPGQPSPGAAQPWSAQVPSAQVPPAQYPQPGYAAPGYAQPGYAQPGYAPQADPQQAYAQPGYAAPGYAAPADPQQAYAQPGYAPQAYAQPGYAQPGYAQPGYGAPYGAAVTLPPMTPSGMGLVMKAFVDLPTMLWRGDADGALDYARTLDERTGKPWLWWLVVHLVWGFAAALIVVGIANRAMHAASSLNGTIMRQLGPLADLGGYGYVRDPSLPAGFVLGVFVACLVLYPAAGALRAVTHGWVLRTRGVAAPFWVTANLTATQQSIFTFVVVGLAVLNLIPSVAWGGVLAFVSAPILIMYVAITEGLGFMGLVRLAPGATKSLLVPYAACWVAFSAIMGLGLVLVLLAFGP